MSCSRWKAPPCPSRTARRFCRCPFSRVSATESSCAKASGLRLEYWRHLFHGGGTAVEQSIFAGRDSDGLLLNRGDTIEFTADFEGWNLSLPLFGDPRDLEFRAVIYRSVIRKPTR